MLEYHIWKHVIDTGLNELIIVLWLYVLCIIGTGPGCGSIGIVFCGDPELDY